MFRGRRHAVSLALTLPVLALLPLTAASAKDRKRGGGDVPAVHAYPGPGWGYAGPRTGITLRGDVTAADLRPLRVVGSQTGRHAVALRDLRGGLGAVLEPRPRFEPGERVSVRLPVPVVGAKKGRFSFTVARSTGDIEAGDEPKASEPEPWLDQLALPCPLQQRVLKTLPELTPEPMCAVGSVASGRKRLLLSLKPKGRGGGRGRWAAAVLSRTGRILWYTQAPYELNDLKSIVLGGERVLALFVRPDRQDGAYELLDDRYQPAGRITTGNGFATDSHDLQVAEDGTIWVGSYAPLWRTGTRRVTDYVVQQLDPETRDVLFEWHALDHVPPQVSSYRGKPAAGGAPWDYFHGNAIEPPTEDDPTLLVSGRNTSAVYGIDPLSGDVEWILGGRHDRFGIDPSWQFCAQHDVRRTAGGDITLFDNGGTRLNAAACPVHPARSMRFRLDVERRKARLVAQTSSVDVSENRVAYQPGALGSARTTGSGSWLVDWGTAGRVTQLRPDGRVAFRLALGQRSYRAVLDRWSGRPLAAPRVAVARPGGAALDVFASWNGSTAVRGWRVLAGPAADRLAPVGAPVPWADLETTLRVETAEPVLAVQALDRRGRVIGQSHPVGVPSVPAP